ncbi:M23 family metallopeptidase [Plantactinospora sp. S1510]|uniref:M23 family metallopeptidase n=1 Tax=Plantactinospora alkalitolerans TaxID=2789879 RepID=A0ABS0GV60_9ACTN|nr:M23 family metallopeptidase [Plantactinospora alkalitolerans]MBF9129893.1 M23 family metallopeptidase [Plantactinospora alkalitolerans]
MERTWHHRTVAALLSPSLALLPVLVGSSGQPRQPRGTAVAADRAVAEADTVRTVVAAEPRRVAPVRTGFRWPLDGTPRVVRRFDPPPQPWQRGHRGVDLGAPSGAVVRATGPGVVHFAGTVAGRPVVSVSHAGGLRSTYEPVRSAVAAGDQVGPGDPLGVLLAGHPGCAGAACLHWGLRRGDEYLDPLLLLGLGRVRLLPVPSVLPVGAGMMVPSVLPVGAGTAVRTGWRAGPAGVRRAARTPPPGCRPGRTAAATLGPARR